MLTLEGTVTLATGDAARKALLGRVLQAGLTEREMTVSDLAEKLGRPYHTVLHWVQGKNAPAIWDVVPLSQALGLPAEWLLTPESASLTRTVREVEEFRLAEALAGRAAEVVRTEARKSRRSKGRG